MLCVNRKQRISRLQDLMRGHGVDALILGSNVGMLYTFGAIFSGVVYVPQKGDPVFFVRRPERLYSDDPDVCYVRKIEELADRIDVSSVKTIALELDELSYGEIIRQHKIFGGATLLNASQILRKARMVKFAEEIDYIRKGASKHMEVYREIPKLYRPGMTDRDLQIEIEKTMRLHGSEGIFRTFGGAMEIYMGSLLAGDNASAPSPYDFALGGGGSDALPLGANGTLLKEGMSVMIDMAGNYGAYLTDMTRTFSIGRLSDEAYRLHDLSRRMHKEVMLSAKLGDSCGELYLKCVKLAKEEHAEEYFMGWGQRAQFVGHGLGLQINELPVLTGKSRDVLTEGMVIAFEPKFVISEVGAVGFENTYLVTSDGVDNLTPLEDEIISLI